MIGTAFGVLDKYTGAGGGSPAPRAYCGLEVGGYTAEMESCTAVPLGVACGGMVPIWSNKVTTLSHSALS